MSVKAEQAQTPRLPSGFGAPLRTGRGSATLSSIEHWIELTVECHPTGSLSVSGIVADDPGMRNTLHFVVEGLDQTDLPPLVDALVAVEERFPVLGRR
ncbi:WapI family immunity protein [Nonomuraea recticatena]